MSTAVCTVMCREPVIRAPARGCSAPNSSRSAMRPGISCCASRIWCRPASASDRSRTAWSRVRLSGVVEVAAKEVARSVGAWEVNVVPFSRQSCRVMSGCRAVVASPARPFWADGITCAEIP